MAAIAVSANISAAEDEINPELYEFFGGGGQSAPDAIDFASAIEPESASVFGNEAVSAEPESVRAEAAAGPVLEGAPAASAASGATKPERESGYENTGAMNFRLGIGNMYNFGYSFNIPVGETQRIDFGIAAGGGFAEKGYGAWTAEALAFYEIRFDVDDGALGWYLGVGGGVGWYGTWGDSTMTSIFALPPPDTSKVTFGEKKVKDNGFGLGVGMKLGVEVCLNVIDPEHSLYSTFKNITFGLDMRPMLYIQDVRNYPKFVLTVGILFRYAL